MCWLFWDAFFSWLFQFAMWVMGQLELPPVPGMVGDAADQLKEVVAMAAGLCSFVAWDQLLPAMQVAMGFWVGGLTFRLVRIIGGFFVG